MNNIIDECKISINLYGAKLNDKSFEYFKKASFVNEYKNSKEIYFKKDNTNLTLTITYYDIDNNYLLSKPDYFILRTKNDVTNEIANFTDYIFIIKSSEMNNIGSIYLKETLIDDTDGLVSESSIGPSSINFCLIGIVFLVIFILIQFYLLLKRL
jgi:hypothetical protein